MRVTAFLTRVCCSVLCCCACTAIVLFPAPSSQAAQKVLTVAVVEDPPFLIREGDGKWAGLNVDIWKRVAANLKVDYAFREMSLKEALASVQAGSVDLSIEGFFVTSEREKGLDFSFPFGNARLAVATPPDKVAHPWWTAIRMFFSWSTMKVVGMLCVILALLGLIFWAVERKANPDHFGGGLRGIGSGIYWAGSTLASGVCFGINLKSFPARLLGLAWMLACAVALSALIASLSAALSAERLTGQAVSDETIRRMLLGGVKESVQLNTVKNLGAKYILFDEERAALDALVEGKIEGFLYDEITLTYYRDNDYKGKISVYPTSTKRFSFGFIFPKGSPLRTRVNGELLSFMESPDWKALLMRYGLKENFEHIEAPVLGKRRAPGWS